MSGQPGRSGRPRTLPPTRIVAFQTPVADLDAVEVLRFERHTAQAAVLRDALHVGIHARMPLARAVAALAHGPEEGESLWAGPQAQEARLREQLSLELLILYGDLVLGQQFHEPVEEDMFADALRRERLKQFIARCLRLLTLVREDLKLPPARESEALCADLAYRLWSTPAPALTAARGEAGEGAVAGASAPLPL